MNDSADSVVDGDEDHNNVPNVPNCNTKQLMTMMNQIEKRLEAVEYSEDNHYETLKQHNTQEKLKSQNNNSLVNQRLNTHLGMMSTIKVQMDQQLVFLSFASKIFNIYI
jgi:hypothetical protein